MSRTTVRISERGHDLLRNLAQREGAPMQAVLERALESYRRQRFLEEVNQAYAALHRDPRRARGMATELAQWERTLADGLEPEPLRGASSSRVQRTKRRRKS